MILRNSIFFWLFLPFLLFANGEMDEPKENLTKEPTDFSECQKRVAHSMIEVSKGEYGVLIAKDKVIYYSKKRPLGARILRHDPYLGLYLLSVNSDAKPLEISESYQKKQLASITKSEYQIGEVKTLGKAIGGFATFSAKTPPNSVVASICYQIHGLGVGGNEFIEARYINKFLGREYITYADMGIEVREQKGGVEVSVVDIFFAGNPFLEGDRIVDINGEKVGNLRDYYDAFIYEPIGKSIKVGIIRNGGRVERTVTLGSHDEGGFLERLGVMLDKSLRVVKNEQTNEKLKWLKSGDKILSIERMEVVSLEHLKRTLSGITNPTISILIEREGFQFFINIPNGREM